jgi:MFS family permease
MLERNTQRWVLLNCYWVSLSLQSTALLTLAIPTELSQIQPQEATFLLALLSSGSALLSTLIPPLAGAYSDAQHRRGIRRAPLIWLGGIVDLAGLLVMMSSWDPAGLAAGFRRR